MLEVHFEIFHRSYMMDDGGRTMEYDDDEDDVDRDMEARSAIGRAVHDEGVRKAIGRAIQD